MIFTLSAEVTVAALPKGMLVQADKPSTAATVAVSKNMDFLFK
jgi:hypothetical protein